MKKTVIALSLAALSVPALAQQKAAEPAYTISSNVGLFSDYRFRGISQTDLGPALQGGFDYAHKSGFYLGTWASSVSSFTSFSGAGAEIDFYGGYKFTVGQIGIDVGNLYYYYPGAQGSPKPNTNEIYVGLSYGPATLKTSYATTKYFATTEKSGSLYFDLSASFPLPNDVTLTGHVGYLDLKSPIEGIGSSGLDYKIGVSKAFGAYSLSAAYVANTGKWADSFKEAEVSEGRFKDLGKNGLVLSLSAAF